MLYHPAFPIMYEKVSFVDSLLESTEGVRHAENVELSTKKRVGPLRRVLEKTYFSEGFADVCFMAFTIIS